MESPGLTFTIHCTQIKQPDFRINCYYRINLHLHNHLPHGEDENKGVKAIVLRQSRSFTKLQPKKSSDVKPLPTRVTFQKMDSKKQKDAQQNECLFCKDLKKSFFKSISRKPKK
ncbi:hypothetical protein KUTeg_020721 [Tegillarca granosa]|uniref:Uncharacterized protein n=1 Tax=Tegillarca granosa TaxID=220873 RepID=A0ABQ9E8T1_TEGGR|nr:hypothetical protein KUTeg_020721 [Tegillarca granosa]